MQRTTSPIQTTQISLMKCFRYAFCCCFIFGFLGWAPVGVESLIIVKALGHIIMLPFFTTKGTCYYSGSLCIIIPIIFYQNAKEADQYFSNEIRPDDRIFTLDEVCS